MRNALTTVMTTLLAMAFSQPCSAQFDEPAASPAANPTPPSAGAAGPIALGRNTGTIPTSKCSDPKLGITFESTGGLTPGLKVVKVDNLGLSKRNGLEAGDIILEVNGTRVSNSSELQNVFRSLSASTRNVQLKLINVRNGLTESIQYEMTTEAGMYQTNFGRIELTQTPTNTPGVSLLEGTLHFYNGSTSTIKGTLSANSFRGTSTNSTRRPAPFQLTKHRNLFEGHVTQGGQRRFVFVKRN